MDFSKRLNNKYTPNNQDKNWNKENFQGNMKV